METCPSVLTKVGVTGSRSAVSGESPQSSSGTECESGVFCISGNLIGVVSGSYSFSSTPDAARFFLGVMGKGDAEDIVQAGSMHKRVLDGLFL
jgi:hypothetical protein